MSNIITPDFTAPDAKTRNLIERMSRFDLHDRLELIRNSFSNIVFRTRFTLADQVLLHGLVSSQSSVEILNASQASKGDYNLKSLIEITKDVYDIQLVNDIEQDTQLLVDTTIRIGSKTSFAGKDASLGIVAVNPLADWSNEDLVQYVLDHEVPVNPADMPGFASRVA